MDTTTLVLVGLAIALFIYALIRDQQIALTGLKLAGSTLWQNLVMLLAGFLIAGLMQVLLPKELISKWLGAQAGGKAIWIGCLVGGLFPGSPYSTFPIVASLYQSGAGLGAVVGFITAWALWSVTRLPIEMALLDPKVALIRYAITFVVPPAAGYLASGLSKLIK
jgi:uncharacterized membrane protein YraQ (UPF0718 family)